jgi:hypothetical protein
LTTLYSDRDPVGPIWFTATPGVVLFREFLSAIYSIDCGDDKIGSQPHSISPVRLIRK